jgi:hypothetical protein
MQRFITIITNVAFIVALSQFNAVHILKKQFSNMYFNIVMLFTSSTPKWILKQNFVSVSCLSNTYLDEMDRTQCAWER